MNAQCTLQILFLMIAGRGNHRPQAVIAYLQKENRTLVERVGASPEAFQMPNSCAWYGRPTARTTPSQEPVVSENSRRTVKRLAGSSSGASRPIVRGSGSHQHEETPPTPDG